MTTTRKNILTALAVLTLVAVATTGAVASQPKALLVAPQPGYELPRFGFNSFNIQGVGERVTSVHWNSRAAQLGLEPGDIVLRMNGFPLSYHGAWNDALYQALTQGGWVQLAIRDVRTGLVVHRQTFVGNAHGPIGPITPKAHAVSYLEVPPTSHVIVHSPYGGPGYGYPSGPVTSKSVVGPQGGNNNNVKTIKDIVKMFDNKKKL